MSILEVPFSFERNQICVEVMLNRQGPYRMYFDTLTEPSAMEIVLARELGLAFHQEGLGAGAGTEDVVVYELDPVTVDLGEVHATKVRFLAVDLSKLAVDGVIGYSLLCDRLLQIDYPGRIIRFYDEDERPEILADAVERVTLPFELTDDFLLMLDDLWINGKRVRVSLDTGASPSLLISGTAIEYLGLHEEVERAVAAQSTGYRGAFTRLQGKVHSLRLGDLPLSGDDVSFVLEDTPASEPVSLQAANLGNGLLQDFVLTIDYPRREVTLERPAHASLP